MLLKKSGINGLWEVNGSAQSAWQLIAFRKYLLTAYCVLGMFTRGCRRQTHQHVFAV